MDLVTGLVARSLVVAEESVLGTRYRLLETIRQYGEERLAEWGQTSNLLIRHGRFYADLSVRAAEHFYGPDQLLWARQINLEEDNIRSALANAHPHRQHSAGRTARSEPPSPPQHGGDGQGVRGSGTTRHKDAERSRRTRISPRADGCGVANLVARRLRHHRRTQPAGARS